MHKRPRLDLHRKISNINWNEVYQFSLVASYGSIKGAAEVLRLSPSTLSEHISQLEEDLSVQLFHRHGRKLILTEQGKRLAIHAKSMFESGQRLLDIVSPLHLGCYPVSIGCVPGPQLIAAYRWIGDFVARFGPLNLNIQHTSSQELEASLADSKIDFGFSESRPERQDIEFRCVQSNLVRFFVSTELPPRSLADTLQEIPLLVCRSEAATEAFVEKALHDADIVPTAIIASDFPSVLLDLCSRGLGVGAFCEDTIGGISSETLKSLRKPKDAPQIESNLYVLWASDAENTEAIGHLKKLIE